MQGLGLAITDRRTAEEASRAFANDPSGWRVPFAFRSAEGDGYRDLGGTVEFSGVSWDYFDRLRNGGPGRITLHAELTQWASRTDPDARPELAPRARLDIEIDAEHVPAQLPKLRAFVHDPEVPEQPCISLLQLRIARGPTPPEAAPDGIDWGNPLEPPDDWRADAMHKCMQSSSQTLFWVLHQGKLLSERVSALAAPQPSAVSTLGFDIVFATTLVCINSDLARHADRLAATFTYGPAADGFRMQGSFGTWQIAPGGSGTIVHLVLPITAGSLAAQGRLGKVEVDLAGLSVTVETDLTMVPSAAAQGSKELRFAFQAGQVEGARMATVIAVDGPPDKVAQAGDLLKMHLPDCLDANAANFAYVFATVRIAQPGADTWLAPAQCAYCFAQPQGLAETFVALLGSSAVAPIRPQDLRIDPALLAGAVPPGPDSGYLAISKEVYLSKAVLPALQRIFPGTTAGSFRFDAAAQKIVDAGAFALPSVTAGPGRYTPMVRSLEVTADHGALITYLVGDCDMGLNITLHFSARTTCPVTFDASAQAFSFRGDPHPDITSNVDIPWYDYGLLLLGVPGIIVAGVEVAVLTGFDTALRGGGVRLSPARSGSYSLQWGGMRAFQVADAGFADSFYMRGHIQ